MASLNLRHILGLLVVSHRERGRIAVGARMRESITTWPARQAIAMSWLMKNFQQ